MTAAVLESWNDGPVKRAVLDFVAAATTPGPGFVAVADRIATFGNDGTLWVEQPLPPQFDFVFRKWGEEIKADPSLAGQQPYKAIIERDMAFLGGVAVQEPEVVGSLLKAFSRSWAGTTPEEFDAQVREWRYGLVVLPGGQDRARRLGLPRLRDRCAAGRGQSGGARLPGQAGRRGRALHYLPHLTVGVAKFEDLKIIEAEPFDAFAVHPAAVAVYHLGNDGTARKLLKEWPVTSS